MIGSALNGERELAYRLLIAPLGETFRGETLARSRPLSERGPRSAAAAAHGLDSAVRVFRALSGGFLKVIYASPIVTGQ